MQDDDKFDDFDDLENFDDLDDLDLGDDSSDDSGDSLAEDGFVDGGDDFSDEDFSGDAFTDDLEDDDFSELVGEEDEDSIDSSLIASNKSGLLSKFSFNQIVIGAALLVGASVFVFQLMTSKAPPVQGSFQSQVNMSGASENALYGEKNNPSSEQIDAEKTTNNQNTGILNNPDSLDSLEIDFKDTPMPVPISSQESDNDEKILLQKNLGNDFSEFEDEFSEVEFVDTVTIAPEFETPMSDVPPTIETSKNLDENTTSKEMPTKTESGSEIVKALPLRPEINIEEPKIVLVDPVLDVQPKIVDVALPEPDKIVEDKKQLDIPNQDKLSKVENNVVEPLRKELAVKDKKISSLQEEVESLQKQIATLKSESKKSQPAQTTEPAKKKATVKKKAPARSTVQWELRAAQLGKAWVAQKGRDDLQPVVVGDILSGLGRIQDIAYRDNKWIVIGSQGQIKQ